MSRDRFKQYLAEQQRLSTNVEDRRHRGLNGTEQRQAIARSVAENVLRNEPDYPAPREDIEQYLWQTDPNNHGNPGVFHDGPAPLPRTFSQSVEPYSYMTEEMYPPAPQIPAFAEGGWVDDGYDAMGNRTGVAEGTGVPLEVQAIGGALQHANNEFSRSIGAMTAPDDTYNGGLPGHMIKGTIAELQDLGTLGRDAYEGTFDPRSDEGIDRVTRGALTMAGTAYGMGPEGSLGMFVGRKSHKWEPDNVIRAGRLLHEGKAESDVWKETGIGWNRQDKPMAEISDHRATLNIPQSSGGKPVRADYPDVHSYLAAGDRWRMAGGQEAPTIYRMADVLDHPELFEHYPDLADMTLRLRKDLPDKHMGSHVRDGAGNERIELNSSIPIHEQLSTLLHELQHSIQHREGWQAGSNLDAAKSLVGRANREIEGWENLLSIKELKAAGLSDEEIAKMGMDGKLVDASPHEIMEADRLPHEDILNSLDKAYENKKPYTKTRGTDDSDEFATYQRHDGEVQARNTQARHAMDDEERRAHFWKDTEDRQGEPRLLSSEYGQGIHYAEGGSVTEDELLRRAAKEQTDKFSPPTEKPVWRVDEGDLAHEAGGLHLDQLPPSLGMRDDGVVVGPDGREAILNPRSTFERWGDVLGSILPTSGGAVVPVVREAGETVLGAGALRTAKKVKGPDYPHLKLEDNPRPKNPKELGAYREGILSADAPPSSAGGSSTGSMNIMDDVPVSYQGKSPHEFTPQEWHAFGLDHGVPNLGPADEAAWRDSLRIYPTLDGRSLSVPGGIESSDPFTYYDLLHLKSQGVDPSQLDRGIHGALQQRMAKSVTPEEGNQIQAFNGYMFGMTSPNNPLFPNQQAMSRLRARSPEDIARLADSIPWRYGEEVPKELRAAYDKKIAEALGLGAGPNKDKPTGGLGARGSADYTRVAEFAQMFRDRPDFFMKRANEPWDHFVERMSSQTPGLSLKTGSFSGVWQNPAGAEISAIDRHMANKMQNELFATPQARDAFKAEVLDRWNRGVGLTKEEQAAGKLREQIQSFDQVPEAYYQDQLLQLVGQHKTPKALLQGRGEQKGQLIDNPDIPPHLQRASADWVRQPESVMVMSPAYRRALEENDRMAKQAGLSLFPSQWMEWDRIRRRLEPHENMFPGLEKLPPMSMSQHQAAREAHWANGEMRYDKVETPEGERLYPTLPVKNPSRLSYFALPPVVAGGALGALRPEEDN